MQINRIILENYGLYKGKREFDLSPKNHSKKTPIILFGGKNGAGKTTFLHAIRLALYGKRSVGDRISQGQYEEFLLNKIHRNPLAEIQARTAKVGIEFDFVTQGTKFTYYIERYWENNQGKLEETVTILKDGAPLDDVDSEFWESFISDIIPERLSQLFFFDGEKIQDIADDIKGNAAIAEAIQTLLGLDLVEKLKSDLDIYVSKEAKKVSKDDDKKRILDCEKSIERTIKEINILKDESASLRTKVSGILKDIEKAETKLRSTGSEFASARDSNKEEEIKLQSRIEECERLIYQQCQDMFPLSLCPNISKLLTTQLDAEIELNRKRIIASEFLELKSEVEELLAKNSDIGGLKEIYDKISSRSVIDSKTKEIHGLSEVDSHNIKEELNSAQNSSAPKILEITKEIEKLTHKLQATRNSINQAPDEKLLEGTYEELKYFNTMFGQTSTELTKLEETIKKKTFELDQCYRDKKKIVDKQNEYQSFQHRSEQVRVVNHALTEYLKRLTILKVDNLKSEVVGCFNTIARKSEFISDVAIDDKTFEVTVFDKRGNPILKEDLSSGEKQIFAIAFLWALAKTSGRPLPVIIDTPLGRLDSEHRLNLVQNYFPNASHQVVLFSTDTEVDEKLFAELEPHISHCYHLVFDKEKYETRPEEEYFWNKELAHV